MSDLADFFFGSSPGLIRMQLLEISHPSFSQTYRIVRNPPFMPKTVSVTHEGPAGPFTYSYFPMKIRVNGSGNDLGQEIQVTLGDLGEVLPQELARVLADNTTLTKPTLIYREYRSDDLDEPLGNPTTYEIPTIAFSDVGATFVAKPPAFNRTNTGERYTIERLPTMRGFL